MLLFLYNWTIVTLYCNYILELGMPPSRGCHRFRAVLKCALQRNADLTKSTDPSSLTGNVQYVRAVLPHWRNLSVDTFTVFTPATAVCQLGVRRLPGVLAPLPCLRLRLCRLLPRPGSLLCLGWTELLSFLPNGQTVMPHVGSLTPSHNNPVLLYTHSCLFVYTLIFS